MIKGARRVKSAIATIAYSRKTAGGCFKEKLGLDLGGHQDGDPHRRREPYGKTLLA